MVFQIITINGKKILHKLPHHIQNTELFRNWVTEKIIDITPPIGNIATHAASRLQKDLIIRANGHTITDKLVNEWHNSELTINEFINVEWQPRGKGGFIMDVINAIVAIFRFMLFIPKFLIWIGSLIIWMFKVLIYLISVTFTVLSKDGIIGLIKFIVNEIVLMPFKVFGYIIKNIINILGKQTVYGIWGADNARNSDLGRPPSDQLESSTDCDGQRKCYINPDGSVPFPVVIITVLCPPVGVFMEYGIIGWLKILVCFILTLLFYFPGLIYALMLLYC